MFILIVYLLILVTKRLFTHSPNVMQYCKILIDYQKFGISQQETQRRFSHGL